MMSFAYDISFMEQRDSKFWDVDVDLKKVAASLVLWIYCDKINEEQTAIMEQLRMGLPVMYSEGVFRVDEARTAIIEGNREIWEVKLKGYFTKEDLNGYSLNGWQEAELVANSTQDVISSIAELEV